MRKLFLSLLIIATVVACSKDASYYTAIETVDAVKEVGITSKGIPGCDICDQAPFTAPSISMVVKVVASGSYTYAPAFVLTYEDPQENLTSVKVYLVSGKNNLGKDSNSVLNTTVNKTITSNDFAVKMREKGHDFSKSKFASLIFESGVTAGQSQGEQFDYINMNLSDISDVTSIEFQLLGNWPDVNYIRTNYYPSN